ncbi:hypothetical protein K7X08_037910 [Anisodus acutangulus]|uniref:GOST seven transmembrane domain-containing protein n=1 Tax=Anisodus acutangulus TaxID=402998 RepID=A0A9Q1N1S2_9SOLA|nr:hypothetical protein K7X08_037910 [Anisodus acutangulus]
MQSRTGLIETIILEVRDRQRIEDAFSKSNALCCTPKLVQEKFCTVGEDVIQLHYQIAAVIVLGMSEMALWIYLVLPVVFLDASFILWIFSSLSKTLEKLQTRKSMAKLDLYRKFTNSLAIFVLLSIAWVGYELYFNASDPLSELWRISWIIPAFWSLLAFSLLVVVVCILWAPSSNPTRYAYSGETGDDYDEEAISLTTGVRVIIDSGTKLERKEKKGSVSTDHVTDQREDPEEDKR